MAPAPPPPTTRPPTPSSPPSPPSSPAPATYDGRGVGWPDLPRATPPPPATGAIRTTSDVRLASGGTLAAGLVLPRIGGSRDRPLVLTPCEREVSIVGGRFSVVRPSGARDTLVILDPGHGGSADGALAGDGTKEKTLTLALADAVRSDLPHTMRVVMTRTSDIDTGLTFRVDLADRLRADLAVSLHFDAAVDPTYGRVPGTQVYGALSDPHGRRVAGVLYQAERRYLDGLGADVRHRWTHGVEAGALYRRGSSGDYYFLLRESHVTWAISEPLFLTTPAEARLAEDPTVRSGLAAAIASGIVDYLDTGDPGSGWRRPVQRPPDPVVPGSGSCTDPS